MAILYGPTRFGNIGTDYMNQFVNWTDLNYDFKGQSSQGYVQLVYDRLYVVSLFTPRECMSSDYWKVIEAQVNVQVV